MATKSLALRAIEEHHMSKSAGNRVEEGCCCCKSKTGKPGCLQFWIKSWGEFRLFVVLDNDRKGQKENHKETEMKVNLRPCEHISLCFSTYRWSCSVLYFGVLRERETVTSLVYSWWVLKDALSYRSVHKLQTISYTPPLIFDVRVWYWGATVNKLKKSFLKANY